jgi:DNA topoisomerase-2
MTSDIYEIFKKRVWDCNVCTTSNCKVKFQGEPLGKMSFEKYAAMYTNTDTIVSTTFDRWSVCIAPSQDGFEQVSFVNGICTTKGGTHVDHATSQIVAAIGNKFQLKPQQVKNTFFIFVKATLENPSFSSQVKSECTSKLADFGSRFEPPASFVKAALRSGIQEELQTLSKYKEMQQLKKTDAGVKKSKISGVPKLDDANKAGTAQSNKCTLIVTEGDSAKTLAVAGLSVVGRDYYGVFPLRGKCKNVRDASVKTLTENKEFSDLKKILGLQQGRGVHRPPRPSLWTSAHHDRRR